ncbi:MAG: hypothetical protein U5L45_17495 [Saprospiraceae bacterium]|nr:hypothetical protein [Saprospiraceae bacterium]
MTYCKSLVVSIICLFLLFLAPLSISAQGYGIAAGVRVGSGFGISYQHQIAHNTTLEGILLRSGSSTASDATVSVLYESHKNILTKGLNMYAGGGVYYTLLQDRPNLITQPTNAFGISPIAGAELTVGKFNVSIDFKPNIKLAGGNNSDIKPFDMQSAFTIRYVLAGRFYKNDEWMFWKKWGKKR